MTTEMLSNGVHKHHDVLLSDDDDDSADGYNPPTSDPHKRSSYLPSSTFSPLTFLYSHRPALILASLLLLATLGYYSTSSHPSLPSSDTGGATSGKEVNLYRLRAASSYPLPSSLTPKPFPSLSSLISGQTAPGLQTLLTCTQRSGGRMAVMTSISPFPTAAEVGLALLSQVWCVVVIGDKKGPSYSDFTSTAAVSKGISAYLDKMALTKQTDTPSLSDIDPSEVMRRIAYVDVQEQHLLPYSLSALTPYGSFSRKNLGFLLAFHSHAQVIFDVDDDNIYLPNTAATGNEDLPIDLQPLQYPASQSLDLQVKGKVLLDTKTVRASPPTKGELEPVNVTVFNPYPLYGAEDAWPRGFPLNWVRPSLKVDGFYDGHCLTTTRSCSAVVQQWLANQDPDVDAIFRLTNERGMPFYFLAPHRQMTVPAHAVSAPSVALPAHTYTPFNAQATIITPGAFFAMLLPFTVHGRVSDIWRSYIMETLLTYYTLDYTGPTPVKTIKGGGKEGAAASDPCVVFTPPRIYHDRNAHNYQLDFNSELPLYTTAESLVSWLTVRQREGQKDLLGGGGKAGDGDRVMGDVMWKLYVDLYEAQVVEESELAYVQAWLSDVSRIPPPSKQDAAPQGNKVQHETGCFPSYHKGASGSHR